MRFNVLATREKGWPLPRHRTAFLRPIAGDLIVLDAFEPTNQRHCRIATLRDPAKAGSELLPRLYDAYLVSIRHETMTLAGFEIIEELDRKIQYAQCWVLTAATIDPVREG